MMTNYYRQQFKKQYENNFKKRNFKKNYYNKAATAGAVPRTRIVAIMTQHMYTALSKKVGPLKQTMIVSK